MEEDVVAAILLLNSAGWSKDRIAKVIRHGAKGRPIGATESALDERNDALIAFAKTGKTLEECGASFGITRERARQILARSGVEKTERGKAIKSFLNARENNKTKMATSDHWERRTMELYGCSCAEMSRLNGGQNRSAHGSRCQRFWQQKRHALSRGIEWQLSFPAWCDIWEKSGHEAERGKGGDKYCMARHGDSGAYSADNVYITTNRTNSSDSFLVVSGEERAAKRAVGATGMRLSPRQTEIFTMFQNGSTAVEIAKKLGIQYGTAYSTLAAAKRKVQIMQEAKP